jgi:hypothetical protein
MKNRKIREYIAKYGLKYWEVAEAAGISSSTLTVWLRQELTGERLSRIQAAIDRLSKGGTEHENT